MSRRDYVGRKTPILPRYGPRPSGIKVPPWLRSWRGWTRTRQAHSMLITALGYILCDTIRWFLVRQVVFQPRKTVRHFTLVRQCTVFHTSMQVGGRNVSWQAVAVASPPLYARVPSPGGAEAATLSAHLTRSYISPYRTYFCLFQTHGSRAGIQ